MSEQAGGGDRQPQPQPQQPQPHGEPAKIIDAASFSRPLPPPDPVERLKFEERAASSMNRPAADGLVALLRDHPELVSSSLAKEAERRLHLSDVPRNTRVRAESYVTPVDEENDEPSTLFPSSTPPEMTVTRSGRRSSSSSALAGSGIAMTPFEPGTAQPPM